MVCCVFAIKTGEMERYEESVLRGRRKEERPLGPGMLGRNPTPTEGHPVV